MADDSTDILQLPTDSVGWCMNLAEMERQLETTLQQLIVREQALTGELERVKAERLRQEGALLMVRQLMTQERKQERN